MPNTWEQMTEAEKIEDLRRDVVRIFDVLNQLRSAGLSQAERLSRVETSATQAADMAKSLQHRLDKTDRS